MDLRLDSKKGPTFDCSTCDARMQVLRNCSGQGRPAKNLVNGQIYPRCPQAMVLDSPDAQYLVDLWGECRDNHTYPVLGGYGDQTAFSMELFRYLDHVTHTWQRKQNVKHQREMDKLAKKGGKKAP